MISKKIPALVFAILVLISAARAQVIVGNSIVGRDGVDGATTTFVLHSQGFGASGIGLSVTSWSYFGGANGKTLTPVLFELSSGTTYTVRGIGASVTSASGAQVDLPFNAITGSAAITNGNFYFGWKDGPSPSGGSIMHANSGGSPQVVYYLPGGPAGFAVSNSYAFTTLDRAYSISATATAIPEPSVTAALFGVAVLGVALWRRQKISAARLS